MLITIIIGILIALVGFAAGYFAHRYYSQQHIDEYKSKLRSYALRTEELSKNYDDYRRKYLDLDDRFQEVKNMEQTYRVAYQEWKQKYDDLREQSLQKAEAMSSGLNEDHDDEDQEILYHSWKRRAKKFERELIEAQKMNTNLEKEVTEITDQLAQTNALRSELARLQNDLVNMVRNINIPAPKDLGEEPRESEVFDIKE